MKKVLHKDCLWPNDFSSEIKEWKMNQLIQQCLDEDLKANFTCIKVMIQYAHLKSIIFQ